MNCPTKDALTDRLAVLNNKLNALRPEFVQSEEVRAEIQVQREEIYAKIKHHRAKGHDGKRCPAAAPNYR